jgi:hypothetical protein
MKKGKMTEEENQINIYKSSLMKELYRMEVTIGIFNMQKFIKDKGLEGLKKLYFDLSKLNSELKNLLK